MGPMTMLRTNLLGQRVRMHEESRDAVPPDCRDAVGSVVTLRANPFKKRELLVGVVWPGGRFSELKASALVFLEPTKGGHQ